MQKRQGFEGVTRSEKAIAFLNQYQNLKVNIQKNEEKSALLKSRCKSTQMNLDVDRVQTSPKDRMSELMTVACDLDAKIERMKERLEKVKIEIILKLCELDNKEHKVLALHYIDGLTFAEISQKIYMCERHTYRIHEAGLKHLAKIL